MKTGSAKRFLAGSARRCGFRRRIPMAEPGRKSFSPASRRSRHPVNGCPSFRLMPRADSVCFEKNAPNSETDFQAVAGPEEAAAALAALRDKHGWTVLGRASSPVDRPAAASTWIGDVSLWKSVRKANCWNDVRSGITACDALIAQTGSILLTARSAGGRALSVLPPHHVVIATADQLLPDLPAAFELLYVKYGDNYPSFATFITGPSRTGDIERILVLGAHGPRDLTILLIWGNLTKACCERSRRDHAIVAWHEVEPSLRTTADHFDRNPG